MKKIIIILLLVMSPILVRGEETVDVKVEYVKDVYWNYNRNNTLYSGNFAYFYVNDKIAYCMDLDVPFNSNIYKKTNKVLSSNIIYKFVYFGYGYAGYNALEDYMATQKILWKYTDSVQVYFTTKPNGQGEIIDISQNEKKIKERFGEYSIFPDYGNLKFIIGTESIITDKDNVQYEFFVQNESKNDISLNVNNSLIFKANEFGKSKFYLLKKYKYYYDNVFYVSDNSPELLVVGNLDDIRNVYFYEVVGGSINVNVSFDKEKDKSITSNVFKLYNSSNNLIGIYSPDENGNIKISNLKADNYVLKHDKITEGYSTLEDEYVIGINENNLNVEKNINLITNHTKLIIKKTHSNVFTKNIEYDKDVLFKIYDEKDNCIKELITDENGVIKTNLEYGNNKFSISTNF